MKRVWLVESPLVLAVAVGFGLWILLQLLQQALWVLVLVLLAIILAAAMMPIVHLLRKVPLPPGGWRIPKAIAVLIIYIFGAAALALLLFVLGRVLLAELAVALETIPGTVLGLVGWIEGVGQAFGVPDLVPSEEALGDYFQNLAANLAATAQVAARFVEGFTGFLFQLFLVLALALFMIVESEQIFGFWVGLFHPAQRDRVRELTRQAGRKIGYWLLGQIAIAATLGVLAGLAAWVLGLPYPLLIGVVTAVIDLLPVVGPTLMVLPAFLPGLTQSLPAAVAAAVVFFGLAEFNAHVLTPIIERLAVRISITLILIAVPTGLALYGPIGALIAIPVAAALQLAFVEVFLPWMREQQGVPPDERGEMEEGREEEAA